VAVGFASLAVGQPVLAVTQFRNVLKASDISTETVRSLHNYIGTALLFANRPDLAITELSVPMTCRPVPMPGWA